MTTLAKSNINLLNKLHEEASEKGVLLTSKGTNKYRTRVAATSLKGFSAYEINQSNFCFRVWNGTGRNSYNTFITNDVILFINSN